MERTFHDSLPATDEDYQLKYEGYHGIPSWCRVRVYRPTGLPPVIVATEPYEVEDSGTSITNRAEHWFIAWRGPPRVSRGQLCSSSTTPANARGR